MYKDKEFPLLISVLDKAYESGVLSSIKFIPPESDPKDPHSTKEFESYVADLLGGHLNPTWEDSLSNLVHGDIYVQVNDENNKMHYFEIDIKVSKSPGVAAGISPESLNGFNSGYYALFNSDRSKLIAVSRNELYYCLASGSKADLLNKGVSYFNLNSEYIRSRINIIEYNI